MFLDRCNSIQEHSSDGITSEIKLCPGHRRFLTISLSSLALFSAENPNRLLLSKFFLTEKQKNESGFFSQCAWLNRTTFAVLLTSGEIFIFVFSNQTNEITIKNVIKHQSEHSMYTAISSFFSYIVAGDNEGRVSIIAPDSPSSISHHVIDFPIKRICTNGSHGLLLSANRSAYQFQLNKSVLVDSEFDFMIKELPIKYATSIAICPKNSWGAAFDPSGFIYVTNFNDYENKFKSSKTLSASFAWSFDGSALFTIFNDGYVSIISTVTRMQRRIKYTELAGCRCACVGKSHIFASTTEGLVNVPLLFVSKCSSSPLVYGPTAVYAFRATQKKACQVAFSADERILGRINQIEYAVSDRKMEFIAVAGRDCVCIIKQVTSEWIIPEQPVINCRGLAWRDNLLCAISFVPDTLVYSLIMFKLDDKVSQLVQVFSYNLPAHPLSISADEKYCVVSLSDKLLVFNDRKLLATLDVDSPPILATPYQKSDLILCLSQSRNIVAFDIDNNTKVDVASDCSDFTIDTKFGMIFIQKELRIRLSSLSRIKFGPFVETSDITVGVFPLCSSLLLLQSSSSPPFSPNLSPFFDLSIVSELVDPEKAARIVSPLSGTPQFRVILRHVSVFALREKMGKLLVPFLQHFPNDMNDALASSLRAVESPERVGVIQTLGPISSIFMKMGELHTEVGGAGIIKFVQNDPRNDGDIFTAALLLPVIMEEEGPNVAFPAAIYVLGKSHMMIDFVESLVRFLDPLLSGGKETVEGMVDCVGMKMTRAEYVELYSRMMKTFETSFLDLMVQYKPHIALQFSRAAKLDITSILRSNTKYDENSQLNVILDKIAPLITSNILTKKDANVLLSKTTSAGWFSYSAALYLVTGDAKNAISIISHIPRLRQQIAGSQWQYLLDF